MRQPEQFHLARHQEYVHARQHALDVILLAEERYVAFQVRAAPNGVLRADRTISHRCRGGGRFFTTSRQDADTVQYALDGRKFEMWISRFSPLWRFRPRAGRVSMLTKLWITRISFLIAEHFIGVAADVLANDGAIPLDFSIEKLSDGE